MTDVKHEVQPEGITTTVDQYVPSVHLEISKEQLGMLEIGNVVEIKIRGKVTRLAASDEENLRYDISLDLQEVKIDPEENDFSKLVGED